MTLTVTIRSKGYKPETLRQVLEETLSDDVCYAVRQTGKYVCIFDKHTNTDAIRIYNTGKQFVVCLVTGVILYGEILSVEYNINVMVLANESKFRKKVTETGKIHL